MPIHTSAVRVHGSSKVLAGVSVKDGQVSCPLSCLWFILFFCTQKDDFFGKGSGWGVWYGLSHSACFSPVSGIPELSPMPHSPLLFWPCIFFCRWARKVDCFRSRVAFTEESTAWIPARRSLDIERNVLARQSPPWDEPCIVFFLLHRTIGIVSHRCVFNWIRPCYWFVAIAPRCLLCGHGTPSLWSFPITI